MLIILPRESWRKFPILGKLFTFLVMILVWKEIMTVYWNHLNFFICRDINSVSNVVTGEFQDAILLRCKDDNEQSLVHYLCQGSGLLMLQTLCILASKVRLKIKVLKLNTLIHITRLCKLSLFSKFYCSNLHLFMKLFFILLRLLDAVWSSTWQIFWSLYLQWFWRCLCKIMMLFMVQE